MARENYQNLPDSLMSSQPDWKLPKGISRGLWSYARDSDLAKAYDQRLAGTPLLKFDLEYAAKVFAVPGRLIDLGCGTGRLLIPFAQRGFSVVGVDLSLAMLGVAAAKAKAASLAVPLIQANLVELDCVASNAFDIASCLFSTLGMVTGAAERRRVLVHAFRILKPGGRFLLHVHSRGFHIWTRTGRRWLLRDWWKRLRRWPNAGDFVMPSHDGVAGLALHHFTRREAVRELQRSGFARIQVLPVGIGSDCHLPRAWWLPGLRAYGFLLSAVKLAESR